MYRSKHAGRNRVSGVPVMDEEVIGRSATAELAEVPPDAVRESAEAAREQADNSV